MSRFYTILPAQQSGLDGLFCLPRKVYFENDVIPVSVIEFAVTINEEVSKGNLSNRRIPCVNALRTLRLNTF